MTQDKLAGRVDDLSFPSRCLFVTHKAVALIRLQTVDDDLLNATATGLGEGVTYVSPVYQLHVRVWEGLGVFGSYAGAFQAKRIIAAPSKQVGLSYDF